MKLVPCQIRLDDDRVRVTFANGSFYVSASPSERAAVLGDAQLDAFVGTAHARLPESWQHQGDMVEDADYTARWGAA